MNTLRKGEMCPLHRSFYCCGRHQPLERAKKGGSRAFNSHGVRRIEDRFHPRGYREVCSAGELRRRKHRLMSEPASLYCFYCNENLRVASYSEIDLCHKEPKGMGGARHDDHFDNLVLGHHSCNLENGSKRPEAAEILTGK